MKSKNQFVSVVIAAGGKGKRMNMGINKQFIEIYGIPILARTLRPFQDCSLIDEIVLVINEKDNLYCRRNIIDEYNLSKVKRVVWGGKERQQSVYNGLMVVDSRCDIVLVHDGARPFIREEEIVKCINSAAQYGAACIAVPVKDTIKVVDNDGFVTKTPERSTLWATQTPQGFWYDILMDSHQKAIEENFIGTDDAVLVERIGKKIKLVKGDYFNIKTTTPDDLFLAEAIAEEEDVRKYSTIY